MRMLRISALGVGLLLAATACASADHSVQVDAAGAPARAVAAQHRVLAAAQATDALTTGRFTATTAISGGSVGLDTGPIMIDGAFDRARQASEVTVAGTSALDGLKVSTVVIGGVSYIEVGNVGEYLGVDTPWISIDVAKLAHAHGLASHLPGASNPPGPQSLLDLLRGVSDQVTTVGPETVAGTGTTHYRASVVPSKALTQLPAADQSELRQALDSLGSSLNAEITKDLDTPIAVDVWIDAAGHVLKGSESVTEGTLGTVTTTYQLTGLGQPVTIAAPPASQVTPAADIPMFKALLGGH